jgi:hypothetical protein
MFSVMQVIKSKFFPGFKKLIQILKYIDISVKMTVKMNDMQKE